MEPPDSIGASLSVSENGKGSLGFTEVDERSIQHHPNTPCVLTGLEQDIQLLDSYYVVVNHVAFRLVFGYDLISVGVNKVKVSDRGALGKLCPCRILLSGKQSE